MEKELKSYWKLLVKLERNILSRLYVFRDYFNTALYFLNGRFDWSTTILKLFETSQETAYIGVIGGQFA